ncbi:transporter substrate-binding domain-containing protein [Halobacteriovorax sp. JY17]|uniref:substrate-binding periplasmic protein n=1 Tax=Halobacteriovorax sp. JY17 TaxID=2014617 RepID=UPI000C54DDF0|nr:transporter substrate-binding domain-containing protein [Halobacteriovorax sp. JY17]PIK15249.1 MAG: hypothetical protein CES88_00640 [Halobacteriovorax sp. JY17]
MYKTILILLFTLTSTWGQTPRKVKIGTFLIPKYVRSKTEGEFVQLISALAKKSDVDIEIVLIPPKRAYYELELGTIEGLFPAMESKGLSSFETISDFYTKEMFVFERAGHDYRKIKNAKVCTTEGYTYPSDFIKEKGWKKIVASSDETCLALLEKKRVDLFIGEIVTVKESINVLGLSEVIKFNQYSPISSDKVTLAFRKGSDGKKLSEKFDKALKEIMIDRSFDKIFPTGTAKIER